MPYLIHLTGCIKKAVIMSLINYKYKLFYSDLQRFFRDLKESFESIFQDLEISWMMKIFGKNL